MAAIVTDQDIQYLRSQYPHTDFDYLSGQEEQLILHFFRGFPAVAAARAAGYKDPAIATKFLKEESTQKIIDMLRDREFANINITKDTLNSMLLSAHAKAATATEEIMAIRELGKLNNLYEDARSMQKNARSVININQINERSGVGQEVTRRQLESLPESELVALAGGGFDFELPDPVGAPRNEEVIDAEWEDVGAERVLNND